MWSNKYINIPFKDWGRDLDGCDCWGLVRLVYQNEFDIALPDFSEQYDINDPKLLHELIAQQKEGWEPVNEPEAGCVVLFRMFGSESHVGIAVSSTHFLHAREKYASAVESFQSTEWKDRIAGYFKYKPNASINMVAVPHPLRTERVNVAVQPGSTLQLVYDGVNQQWDISPKIKKRVTILVNGRVVPPDLWPTTVVCDKDVIEYRAVPGRDAVRLVLTIAVVVVAMKVGLAAAGLESVAALGLSSTGAAQIATFVAVNAAVTFAGTYLVNVIAPIRQPPGTEPAPGSERQLLASGAANRANNYGAIPVVLGKVRITPPLGAQNYSRFTGTPNSDGIVENATQNYLDMLLIWGYGPLQVDNSSLRVGEVPLSNYQGDNSDNSVRFITLDRITEPSSNLLDAFNGIYGSDVEQKYSGITLVCEGLPPARSNNPPWTPTLVPGPWTTLALTSACDKFTVALHFPQGLRSTKIKGDGAGEILAAPVRVDFEYKINNGAWLPWTTQVIGGTLNQGSTVTEVVPPGYVTEGWGEASYTVWQPEYVSTVNIPGNLITGGSFIKDGFTWTITKQRTWNASALIQVRVRRASGDDTEPNDEYRYTHQVQLLTLTGYSNNAPATDPPNSKIAKTALTIKATNQLNGQIEGINALVQTWCKIWNGSNWNTSAATSNPAALYLYVLTHPGNPQRILESELASKIDFAKLQYWYNYCNESRTITLNGSTYTYKFEYNSVLGNQRSVLEVLRDICAAGRGSPAMVDGKWSVVIDEPKPQIIQHFTPHNSWGFESTKGLPRLPDALKVQYFDEDEDYRESELIISYADKSVNTAELFETIQVPGVTSKAAAADHARWHLAQIKLRPEIYSLNTDIEYIVCNRGDRVKVMHDVPMWGLGSGRIKNRVSTTVLELDEEVPLNAGTTYTLRFRSKTGGSTTRTVAAVTQDGYYKTVTLTSAITSTDADVGDLFLFGTVSQESQDLIVLAIEPTNNKSAKITLVDYGVTASVNIFTDYRTLSSSTIFETNITKPPILLIDSIGNKQPTITSITSDSTVMEQIAPGIYRYAIKVSYTNPADLPSNVEGVEFSIVPFDAVDTISDRNIAVPLNQGSATFNNVELSSVYTIKGRYIGRDGRTGSWSTPVQHTVIGRVLNYEIVDTLEVIRQKRNLVITPYMDTVPSDFKYFEIRVWKSQTTGDFWDIQDPDIVPDILVYTAIGSISVDLHNFAVPRLSPTGVKYRVACRILDIYGNYSPTSTLADIVLETIDP